MTYVPLGSGSAAAWEVIETVVVSSDATIDMELTGTYIVYSVHIDNLVPATNGTTLWLRVSTDGGSTFLDTVGDYSWANEGGSTTSTLNNGIASDSKISLTRSFSPMLMGSATAEAYNAWIYFHNAKQATNGVCVTSQPSQFDSGPLQVGVCGRAALIDNIDEIDDIRILSSSGNLTSGTITLYGLNA